jgi:hypothetical protein
LARPRDAAVLGEVEHRQDVVVLDEVEDARRDRKRPPESRIHICERGVTAARNAA